MSSGIKLIPDFNRKSEDIILNVKGQKHMPERMDLYYLSYLAAYEHVNPRITVTAYYSSLKG